MHPGGPLMYARKLAPTWRSCLLGLAIVVMVTVAAAGCGGTAQQSQGATKTTVTACGTAKTAAAVPVRVDIVRGHLACAQARKIAQTYATAVRSGEAPGNGGGGPVKVDGWTCEGFPTPVVLRTGKASECFRPGLKILEVLPPPRSSS